MSPKWDPTPNVVHYFCPGAVGFWSNVVRFIGNRLPFGTNTMANSKSSVFVAAKERAVKRKLCKQLFFKTLGPKQAN